MSPLSSRFVEVSAVSRLVKTMLETESPQFSSCGGKPNRSGSAIPDMPSTAASTRIAGVLGAGVGASASTTSKGGILGNFVFDLPRPGRKGRSKQRRDTRRRQGRGGGGAGGGAGSKGGEEQAARDGAEQAATDGES